MEGVKLSEVELRLFGELFGLCDMDSSGAVSPSKATELFLSSGLPQETLQKVFELCGATRIHQFGRSQFYIALKLIAVAQCGLPVQVESLAAQNIPLPRFNIQRSDMGAPPLANRQNSNPQHINSDPEYTMRASLQHQRSLQQQQQMVQQQQIQQQHQQLQQQQLYQQQFQQQQKQQEYYQQQQAPFPQPQQFRSPTQPPAPPPHHQPPPPQRFMAQGPGDAFVEGQLHQMEKPLQKSEHPEVKPAFSPQENSPPNSPLEKVNGVANAAIGYVQYEGATPQQQAAPNNSANRIEKGWASFEDDSQGLLSGSTANVNQENEVKDWAHFTDSAGSKADTSSISSEAESTDDVWTITDEQREYYVNQFRTMQTDVRGVICGGIAKEFFEKSRLPVQELSRIWQLSDVNRDGALSLEEFCTAMHLVVLRRNDIDLPDTLPPSLMPYLPLTNPDEPFAADLPPGGTMKKLSTASETSQQWGQASPTSSSVSSPGSKPTPVNFEFKPITADSDSQIVHPVALRMSPDGQVTAVDGKGQPEEEAMNASSTAFTNDLVDLGPSDQPSIQSRPRPKKQHSVPATLPDQSQPFIRPPPSDFASERPSVLEMGSSDKPVPPPRKGHSRHASLDNQLLDFLDGEKHAVTPPSADADLIDLPDNESLHGKASRSQSYLGSDDGLDLLPRSNQALPRHGSLDRKDIQALVRKHRDKNIILTRLNSELNQELQEVMEQRIALEIQLEHLKP